MTQVPNIMLVSDYAHWLLGMTHTEDKTTAGLIHVSKQQISKLLAAVLRQLDSWSRTASLQTDFLKRATASPFLVGR